MATPLDRSEMQTALVAAAREVLSDAEIMSLFWQGGYTELKKHAQRGASDWLWARALAFIGSGLVGVGLYLIVRFGGGAK